MSKYMTNFVSSLCVI